MTHPKTLIALAVSLGSLLAAPAFAQTAAAPAATTAAPAAPAGLYQALGAAAGLGAALREDDWKDIFVAWAPSKNVSLTLAYVDLGRIVPGITNNRRQTGYYLSAQVAF